MEYNLFNPIGQRDKTSGIPLSEIPAKSLYSSYEDVRFGEVQGTLDFDKLRGDRIKCLQRLYSQGWAGGFPRDIDRDLLRAVAKLRCSLDFYEQIAEAPVFSKEELYVRCLREGPDFTEFIKKSRAASFCAKVAETHVELDTQHVHSSYTGYDSIFHERYLIHWDDRHTIDDVKYCFMPINSEYNSDHFRECVRALLKFESIGPEMAQDDFDMVAQMRNTAMYDPKTRKTALMREFWTEDVDILDPYFAKRTVVMTTPGSTRDTGVGSPSTVLKVKMINRLARIISENCRYSANAKKSMVNERIRRVLKRNSFLHLDFKKYGLTFPRILTNIIIEEIGNALLIDVADLLIHDFFIDIDGEVYQTARGTCLGWCDSVNALGVSAILHYLSVEQGFKFDHIGFNDDFEISFFSDGDRGTKSEILRDLILIELNCHDIPISMSKTYASQCSVFLEKYVYADRYYGLNMDKTQLCIGSFASSCVSKFPWRAKMHFSEGFTYVKSEYARDRCLSSCATEFNNDDFVMPVWSGGWLPSVEGTLDKAICMSDTRHLELGLMLAAWRPPKYSSAMRSVSSPREITVSSCERTYSCHSSQMGRLIWDPGGLEDVNFEVEVAAIEIENLAVIYTGIDPSWVDRACSFASDRSNGVLPLPPDRGWEESQSGRSY